MLKNIIETRLEFALKLFLEDKFGPISNRFIFIISIYFDARDTYSSENKIRTSLKVLFNSNKIK